MDKEKLNETISEIVTSLKSNEETISVLKSGKDIQNIMAMAKTLFSDEDIEEAISKIRLSFNPEQNKNLDNIMSDDISRTKFFLFVKIIVRVMMEILAI
jgi:hypothetical protein